MVDNALTFNSVDFLPASYREEGHQQRTQGWRIAVLLIIGGCLVGATIYQERLYRLAARELNEVSAQHTKTISLTSELANLETKLNQARSEAELLTYLRHPWPRTRILASVLSQLPEAITLTELHIAREMPPAAPVQPSPPPTDPKAAVKVPLATESDLTKLREERDPAFWVVSVQGTTTEAAALHEFLGCLARESIFTKVDLGSISSSPTTPGASQFTARLVIRPGYGQPHGPKVAAALAGMPDHGAKEQVR